jgi:hypothetical protein
VRHRGAAAEGVAQALGEVVRRHGNKCALDDILPTVAEESLLHKILPGMLAGC